MASCKIEGTKGMQIPFEGKTYTLLEDIHYELDDIFSSSLSARARK